MRGSMHYRRGVHVPSISVSLGVDVVGALSVSLMSSSSVSLEVCVSAVPLCAGLVFVVNGDLRGKLQSLLCGLQAEMSSSSSNSASIGVAVVVALSLSLMSSSSFLMWILYATTT